MADTMEYCLDQSRPPSTQWSTAKLILFPDTYLFFVPIYFQVLHVNTLGIVTEIDANVQFVASDLWLFINLF